MMTVLTDFLPEEVVELIEMYLTYVSDNPSPQLMVFGLVFSIYFPMRAANSLMRRRADGLPSGAAQRGRSPSGSRC